MTTKIKKLSKAKHKIFLSKFNNWIESQENCRKSPTDSFYVIDSIYGELEISSVSINIDMYGYEVFCKFLGDNPKKWNHCLLDTTISVDDAIDYMTRTIKSILKLHLTKKVKRSNLK